MKNILLLCFCFAQIACSAQKSGKQGASEPIRPAAERISEYLPLIKGKKVGIFANQTSMVGKTHLVDTLRKLGVNVTVIFGPEHGFRGTADAGETLGSYTDKATGIPVVSLYGSKKKPSDKDLENVDLLLFDIQDVGVRYYTYISSLQDFMEAAFVANKPLLLLDRPNPNGFYVDGPVMDKSKFGSFVGRQDIPAVYGLTIGEYGYLLIGEKWLSDEANNKVARWNTKEPKAGSFHFRVIPCSGYDHSSKYVLPVRPSPNLPDMQSVYLFPSICLVEGTVMSEGRGTSRPFQVFGHPSLPKNLYSFTPKPNEGAKNSKLYGQVCYGWDLGGSTEEVLEKVDARFQLHWLIDAYKLFPQKDSFFILPKSGKMEDSFFNRLAGNNELWQQLKKGVSEQQIRDSWQPALNNFKKIRKNYLLYPDFDGSPATLRTSRELIPI
ncbi:MAG: DUF1343 domain-containing protein [Chitinophagaceae bacterium]|nr:MAG: DUF1343 domain-containing protein [Chitinophagaceae bacterium]